MSFKRLAIDTSTPVQAIALEIKHNGELIRDGQAVFLNKMNHADELLWNIDQLLKKYDLKPRELDSIAVSIGPGSFTGLRVGISVAKALARAARTPLIPIDTLDLFAYSYQNNVTQNDLTNLSFYVATDARRKEVFVGKYKVIFENEDHVKTKTRIECLEKATTAIPKNWFQALIEKEEHDQILVVGNLEHTTNYLRQLKFLKSEDDKTFLYRLEQKPEKEVIYQEINLCFTSLLDVAAQVVNKDGAIDSRRIEPNYIRPSDARPPKAPLVDGEKIVKSI